MEKHEDRRNRVPTRKQPVMQPRHYTMLAAIIRELPERTTRFGTALHFAKALAKDNPKFKRSMFIDVCGGVG